MSKGRISPPREAGFVPGGGHPFVDGGGGGHAVVVGALLALDAGFEADGAGPAVLLHEGEVLDEVEVALAAEEELELNGAAVGGDGFAEAVAFDAPAGGRLSGVIGVAEVLVLDLDRAGEGEGLGDGLLHGDADDLEVRDVEVDLAGV